MTTLIDGDQPLTAPIGFVLSRDRLDDETWDEIEAAQFAAQAVEPHSTARGFLFFDVTDISHPLAGASFYLMGVNDAKGNELMYFEIPMEKYLSAPEVKDAK